MDDPKSFFSRLCSCDSSKLRNKRSERDCKPGCNGQRAYAAVLFETISEQIKNKTTKQKDTGKPPITQSKEPTKNETCVEEVEPIIKDPCDDEHPKRAEPKKKPCREKPKATCYNCYIKEQNPLAPPCCRSKSEPVEEPCPPAAECQQDYRPPSCGCDYCRKSGYHGQCCDRRTLAAPEPPRLERA